jgi:hypothetical protein
MERRGRRIYVMVISLEEAGEALPYPKVRNWGCDRHSSHTWFLLLASPPFHADGEVPSQ